MVEINRKAKKGYAAEFKSAVAEIKILDRLLQGAVIRDDQIEVASLRKQIAAQHVEIEKISVEKKQSDLGLISDAILSKHPKQT